KSICFAPLAWMMDAHSWQRVGELPLPGPTRRGGLVCLSPNLARVLVIVINIAHEINQMFLVRISPLAAYIWKTSPIGVHQPAVVNQEGIRGVAKIEMAAIIGNDHGQSARHRFEHRHPKTFAPGGQNKTMCL